MATFRKDRYRRRSTFGQLLIVGGLAIAGLNEIINKFLTAYFPDLPQEFSFLSGVLVFILGVLFLISAKHVRNHDRLRENQKFNATFSDVGANALAEAPIVLFLRSRSGVERATATKHARAASRRTSVRKLPNTVAGVGSAVVALLIIVGAAQLAGALYLVALLAIPAAMIYSWMHRLTDNVDHHGDCEEDITAALLNRAHLVAIGDDTQRTRDHEVRGAVKLVQHQANWKQSFTELSAQSCLIIIECGSTDAVIWELEQIIGTRHLWAKALAILPPGATEQDWQKFTAVTGQQLNQWPPYNARGLVCTIPKQAEPAVTLNYKAFLSALRDVRFDIDISSSPALVRDNVVSAAVRNLQVSQMRASFPSD